MSKFSLDGVLSFALDTTTIVLLLLFFVYLYWERPFAGERGKNGKDAITVNGGISSLEV